MGSASNRWPLVNLALFVGGPLDGDLKPLPDKPPFVYAMEPTTDLRAMWVAEDAPPPTAELTHRQVTYRRERATYGGPPIYPIYVHESLTTFREIDRALWAATRKANVAMVTFWRGVPYA